MTASAKQQLLACAALVGTIIGVGTFGLPYVASRAGFWVTVFYLVALGAINILVMLAYAEVALRTNGQHQLVGFARRYLGPWGKRVATLSLMLGMNGALLAYLIVGGQFIATLVGQPTDSSAAMIGSLAIAAAWAAVLWRGLNVVAEGELVLTAMMIAITGALALLALPAIDWTYFALLRFGTPDEFFLPYGVALFALGGASAIPQVVRLLRGHERRTPRVITVAGVFTMLFYVGFTALVLGVTGSNTTPEAFAGLVAVLGAPIGLIGALLGFCAIATSLMTIGLAVEETYSFEYRLPKPVAWALTVALPLLVFLTGLRDFIVVIALVGGIIGSADGLMIAALYWRARRKGDRQPRWSLKHWHALVPVLLAAFAAAFIYELLFTWR